MTDLLTPENRAIWQTMGLGPVWELRGDGRGDGNVDRSAVEAALHDATVWVGDFDVETDADGSAVPVGAAGELLLNMLRAAHLLAGDNRFVSVRGVPDVAQGGLLQQAGCTRAVLMGAPALQAQTAAHGIECFQIDSLADLLAQPQRKAQAWKQLCVIRDRCSLPR